MAASGVIIAGALPLGWVVFLSSVICPDAAGFTGKTLSGIRARTTITQELRHASP
jgi:hypothetical protein